MAQPKTDKRALSVVEKERRCLELRGLGYNFDAIAREVGYSNRSGAYQATIRALKKTLQEPADELRMLEAERLNELYKKTMDRIDKDNLWAVDRALKIMERRASLLGLDTPAAAKDNSAEMAAFLSGVHTVKQMAAEDLSE